MYKRQDKVDPAGGTAATPAPQEPPQTAVTPTPPEPAQPTKPAAVSPDSPTMGISDKYENMGKKEKKCFEAYVTSQMDKSLVN